MRVPDPATAPTPSRGRRTSRGYRRADRDRVQLAGHVRRVDEVHVEVVVARQARVDGRGGGDRLHVARPADDLLPGWAGGLGARRRVRWNVHRGADDLVAAEPRIALRSLVALASLVSLRPGRTCRKLAGLEVDRPE